MVGLTLAPVRINTQPSERVLVEFDHGLSTFDAIWLRDNCHCEKCHHSLTKQKLNDTFDIELDITTASVDRRGDKLYITWSKDGHRSVFDIDWLRNHSYNPHITATFEKTQQSTKVLWDSKLMENIPTIDFDTVMSSEDGTREWVRLMDRYGFCLVVGTPPTMDGTEALANRISFVQVTHYGGCHSITADLKHGDLAFSSSLLLGHTDTTYFTNPIGILMMHILEHDGQGGESFFVDGFKAARILQEQDPTAYRLLSTVRVQSHSAGDEGRLLQPAHGYPILNHCPETGELFQIRYNQEDRSPIRFVDYPDSVVAYYLALRKWREIISDPANVILFRNPPGSVAVVDNWRTLHGRTQFDGHRTLASCYLPHDDYASKVKMLLNGGAVKTLL
ncbi:hypothetical protein HDU88_004756 [Geranomyces variabilis]|nr:hypothetical protein HDU88_004756 [Geranomyces variabilis]